MQTHINVLTDVHQIDVAVNAPEAGTIKEFFANEEDTVVVGQDLLRLETGGEAPAPEAKEESKDESKDKPKEDSPPPKKSESESKPEPKSEEKPAASKPAPPKQSEKKPSKPDSEPAASSSPGMGNREERRVSALRLDVPTIT